MQALTNWAFLDQHLARSSCPVDTQVENMGCIQGQDWLTREVKHREVLQGVGSSQAESTDGETINRCSDSSGTRRIEIMRDSTWQHGYFKYLLFHQEFSHYSKRGSAFIPAPQTRGSPGKLSAQTKQMRYPTGRLSEGSCHSLPTAGAWANGGCEVAGYTTSSACWGLSLPLEGSVPGFKTTTATDPADTLKTPRLI